jgi:hypothetical protein
MSSTIFCTFDQQDVADLAMGRLRNSVRGIHSIQYLSDYGSRASNRQDSGSWLLGFSNMAGSYQNTYGVQPSRPASVKIVCDESARDQVMARLVNLHAYRIVAS